MRSTDETGMQVDMSAVWEAWSRPEDIKRWNAAFDGWHATRADVDRREGGALFDAETANPAELQRLGWSAMLEHVGRQVAARHCMGDRDDY